MRTRVGAAIVAALAVLAGVISGSAPFVVIVGVLAILPAVAILLSRRNVRLVERGGLSRPDTRLADVGATAALAAQASRALVHADDAVRTSEQELGVAIAVFGERAMAPFSVAVASARASRREAFRLFQLIDDGPSNDAITQSRLTDICARCSTASRSLDEQAEAFDLAHNMGARARQLVAEVDALIAQQLARLTQSRHVIDGLATKYTPAAVAPVACNPDHAATRLEFAADCLASAEEAIAAGDRDKAAVLLQAAEASADQATDLLTGVLHLEAELTQAASAVPAALREIDAEIAEATAFLTGTPDEERGTLVSGAQAVSGDVRANLTAGAFDALVALRDLQQADAALDRVLAGVRTQHARRQRAIAVLDESMLVARSSVTAAEDFITTRRGGVGVTARTKLAEAWRHFDQAIGSGQADPEVALTEAQLADALAQQARGVAEQDVAGFDHAKLIAERVATWSDWAGGAGAGRRGAILGGILIDGPAGAIGPGSFGGVATRGRHTVSARPEPATDEGETCPSAASSAGLRS